jgi:hypothetical protein
MASTLTAKLQYLNDGGTDFIHVVAPGGAIVYSINQYGGDQIAYLLLAGIADAINPHTAAFYMVTNAAADLMTLAAPTAGLDDGVTIEVTAATFPTPAHKITSTGNLLTGSAAVNSVTFPNATAGGAGSTVYLTAYNGKWNVAVSGLIAANNFVFA